MMIKAWDQSLLRIQNSDQEILSQNELKRLLWITNGILSESLNAHKLKAVYLRSAMADVVPPHYD